MTSWVGAVFAVVGIFLLVAVIAAIAIVFSWYVAGWLLAHFAFERLVVALLVLVILGQGGSSSD